MSRPQDLPSAASLPRFGKLAVDFGYITPQQLREALLEQLDDDLAERPHRAVGTILLDRGWMTLRQVETVLDRLLDLTRAAESGAP
jgi:hypothetical protein